MSMKEKLAVTVLVTTLALFGLVVVLYRMIKDKNADYTQIVLNQHSSYDSRTIPYRRGDIVDRNGTYLATSEKVYNLILDPNQINQDKENYLEPTVSALCEVFGYDRADILATITANENSYYVPYEKQISADKKEEFEGIYNDMIAYSKTSELMQDADFRQALGDSFIEIAGTDEGKDIIKVFSQVGYEWGDDANYDGERAAQEMLKAMN